MPCDFLASHSVECHLAQPLPVLYARVVKGVGIDTVKQASAVIQTGGVGSLINLRWQARHRGVVVGRPYEHGSIRRSEVSTRRNVWCRRRDDPHLISQALETKLRLLGRCLATTEPM